MKRKIFVIMFLVIFFSIVNLGFSEDKPNFGFKSGYQWYTNNNIGYFTFFGTIGISDFKEFKHALDYFNANDIGKVEVVINSPGGDLYAAIAIAQLMFINNNNIVIETHGIGFVASGATLLLMAGTDGHRFIYDGTTVMMHQVATLDYGGFKNQEERDRELERIKFIQYQFETFYLKKLKIDKEELRRMLANETWFGAKRALEIGLVDEIIEVN